MFEPLDMNDTSYLWNDKNYTSRFASGHDATGKLYDNAKNQTVNAADDLHTTIADYGTFLVSILNGESLNKEVYQEMIKPQVKTKKNKYFVLALQLYQL